MDKITQRIFEKLPVDMRSRITNLPNCIINNFEEIRIRCGHNTQILSAGRELELNDKNAITQEMLEDILNRLLDYSYYAHEEELSKGYVTIEGGHRIGICGRVALKEGKVHLIKDISSLNIRRSREIIGAADKIIDNVMNIETGEISNMLIVSPPKCGKTTMLRDITRQLSNSGFKVGLCDERSEIAGCYGGKSSYDLGSRTDILDGCPKAEGMIMLIRAMSPDVLITDEIGKIEDVAAIESAVSAGVKIVTTIHGKSYDETVTSIAGKLIRNNVFDTIVFLSSKPETGSVAGIMKLNDWEKGR